MRVKLYCSSLGFIFGLTLSVGFLVQCTDRRIVKQSISAEPRVIQLQVHNLPRVGNGL